MTVLFYFCIALTALRWDAHAFTSPPTFSTGNTVAQSISRGGSPLFHGAPKHDVSGGQSAFDDLPLDQQERVKAFSEHQQNVPKIGFPADVRSLVQYNHGFAVMSTNSKS